MEKDGGDCQADFCVCDVCHVVLAILGFLLDNSTFADLEF